MDKKMSLMGVAGKIAAVLVISLVVTGGVSYLLAPAFRITDNFRSLAVIAAVMAIVGFALNLVAAFGMLSAHRKGQLATGGLYSIFPNPMYTCQILITIPGLLLFFNSWVVMLTVIPVFIAFEVFAREEGKYLEEKFGRLYLEYREKVLFKYL